MFIFVSMTYVNALKKMIKNNIIKNYISKYDNLFCIDYRLKWLSLFHVHTSQTTKFYFDLKKLCTNINNYAKL